MLLHDLNPFLISLSFLGFTLAVNIRVQVFFQQRYHHTKVGTQTPQGTSTVQNLREQRIAGRAVVNIW
jgi:hypothetical protein